MPQLIDYAAKLTETQIGEEQVVNLISTKPRFDQLKVGGLIRINLNKFQEVSKQLDKIVEEKAPANLRAKAEDLNKRRQVALKKAVDAFTNASGGEADADGEDDSDKAWCEAFAVCHKPEPCLRDSRELMGYGPEINDDIRPVDMMYETKESRHSLPSIASHMTRAKSISCPVKTIMWYGFIYIKLWLHSCAAYNCQSIKELNLTTSTLSVEERIPEYALP